MKIHEVVHEIYENDNAFRIFVDLDGVLVDFEKFAKEHIIEPHINSDVKDHFLQKGAKRDFWRAVDRWTRSGKQFFGAMDPLPDAFELWDYIKEYFPTILSATGHVMNAKEEKRDWVKRYLGDTTAGMALFTRAASEKCQYAASNHILIDDRAKAIDPWIEAGGIGILHTSAEDTIQQLKKLGI